MKKDAMLQQKKARSGHSIITFALRRGEGSIKIRTCADTGEGVVSVRMFTHIFFNLVLSP